MEEMVQRIADLIIKYGMEAPGILVLESIKPLVHLGASLSRFFVAPWFHLVGINTRHVINTLEEPENVEKLIQLLEKSVEEKEEKKKQEKKKKKEESGKKEEPSDKEDPEKREVETKPKKGWRRFFRR